MTTNCSLFFLVFVYLLLLLLLLEHHLCISDLSSGRNQGQHKRERKTRKTKNVFNKTQETKK